MGREQMRNLETFKIGGTTVNDFEYQKNQGDLTEQFDQHGEPTGKGGKRLTPAERVQQIVDAAHKKVEKRRKKETAKSGSTKKVAASARPAAKAAKFTKTPQATGSKAKQARKK